LVLYSTSSSFVLSTHCSKFFAPCFLNKSATSLWLLFSAYRSGVLPSVHADWAPFHAISCSRQQRQLPISRHPTAGLRIESRLCQVGYFVDLINEPLLLNPIPARFLHEEPQDGATGTTEICAKCLSPREDGSGLICQTNTQANLTGLGQPHSSAMFLPPQCGHAPAARRTS